jgi:hypothetical protein
VAEEAARPIEQFGHIVARPRRCFARVRHAIKKIEMLGYSP